jgi:hypothetical protein
MADIIDQWDFDDLSATDLADVSTIMTRMGFREATQVTFRNDADFVQTGSGAIRVRTTLRYKTPANQSVLGVTFGYKNNESNPGRKRVIDFEYEDGANNLQIQIDTNFNGGLDVRRSDDTIIASTTNNIIIPQFFHTISIKLTCSDTVGQIEIRFGHTVVLNSAATLDTKSHASSATINQIMFGELGNIPSYDNLIVWTGSFFSLEPQCHGLDADGDGDTSAWTPTSGANYTNVDEAVPDDDTTIVETNTVNAIDHYTLENLPSEVDTIYAVKADIYARETASGVNDIQVIQRLSGASVNSATKTLSQNYERHGFVRALDPSGGAWSVADVNSLQIGQELI